MFAGDKRRAEEYLQAKIAAGKSREERFVNEKQRINFTALVYDVGGDLPPCVYQ